MEISELLKNNPIKSISTGTLVILVALVLSVEDRYVKAADLTDFKQGLQEEVQQNRAKYLEDEIFILKFNESDPNENKNLNRALQDRYKEELRQLNR